MLTQPHDFGVARVLDAGDLAVRAAAEFVEILARLDRDAQNEHRSVPTIRERKVLRAVYEQRLLPALEQADVALERSELRETRDRVRELLAPWLLRSRLWSRSWIKPHGHACDFRMLEWMYDLQDDECADPTNPPAANLLDGLFRSAHATPAVWCRRAWFASFITAQVHINRAPVRLLDVACGGSRHVRDVIDRFGPEAVEPAFLDEDPAALAYVRSWLPLPTRAVATFVCAPIDQFHPDGEFDAVIGAGVFERMRDDPARALLARMLTLTRPGGSVAICNCAPDDTSRTIKNLLEWELVYRTDAQLGELFPDGLRPKLSRSPDGRVVYALVTVPATRC
jgi:SAM-dependent methyltransferase